MKMARPAPSDAARILGASGASKGGQATARKYTAEERSERARKLAEARWGKRCVCSHPVSAHSAEGGCLVYSCKCKASRGAVAQQDSRASKPKRASTKKGQP